MKKIKCTKEQHNKVLKEVSVSVDPSMTNGNIQQAITNTQKEMRRDGINPDKVDLIIQTDESRCYTKKSLKEMRFNKLMENAKETTKYDVLKAFGRMDESSEPLMLGDLAMTGIGQLRDNIIRCRDEYRNSIALFFETLQKQGYDIKQINRIITMFELNGVIPKVEINRKEREIKSEKKASRKSKASEKSKKQ